MSGLESTTTIAASTTSGTTTVPSSNPASPFIDVDSGPEAMASQTGAASASISPSPTFPDPALNPDPPGTGQASGASSESSSPPPTVSSTPTAAVSSSNATTSLTLSSTSTRIVLLPSTSHTGITSSTESGVVSTDAFSSSGNATVASSGHALRPKVVAGISVATAAAGAIIAAFIALFLLRRRRRNRVSAHEPLDSYQDHSDTFSGTSATAALEKHDPTTTTSNSIVDLLPPASDFELQEDFTNLNASIRAYVETYCTASSELAHLAQTHRSTTHNLDGLPELLSPTCPLSERHIDRLLKKPTARLAAIRFLIAWNILTNIHPSAPLSSTLLPPEISRCIEALEPIPLGPVSARPASPFRCPCPSSMRIVQESATTSSSDWLMSLHKWRQVIGAAMAAIYSDGVEQQLDFRDARTGNISELTASLDCVLQPFVVKGKGAVRVKELEGVVMRGAQVGWKLFVQGSTWTFGWGGGGNGGEEEEEGGGRFVVFPSLVKVGDEEGKRLGKPLVVAEMEVAEGL